MSEVQTHLEDFQNYRGSYAMSAVIGAMLLKLLEASGVSTTSTPLTPGLIRATEGSGTIPEGTKVITIGVLRGTGTILGTPVDTNFVEVEFPKNPEGWMAIPYTVDANSEFVIVTGS